MIPGVLPASRWQRDQGKALPTRCRPRLIAVFALIFLLPIRSSLAGSEVVTFHFAGLAAFNRQTFDVRTVTGLTNLITSAEALIQLSEAQEKDWQARCGKMRAATSVTTMSYAELKKVLDEPDGVITRQDRRGLKAMQQLARAALATNDP